MQVVLHLFHSLGLLQGVLGPFAGTILSGWIGAGPALYSFTTLGFWLGGVSLFHFIFIIALPALHLVGVGSHARLACEISRSGVRVFQPFRLSVSSLTSTVGR